MKLVLFEWVKEYVAARVWSCLHQKVIPEVCHFFQASTTLHFHVGLIHKENASFATMTFFMIRPCNEGIVLCLDLSLLSHVLDNAH